MVQSEKMASVGQLAAGIAHEINNPMAFVKSNLGTLERYVQQLEAFVDGALRGDDPRALAEQNDIQFVRGEIGPLVKESLEGSLRVESIVKSLKEFAHIDTGEVSYVDIASLLDATLQVAWNQIKYKAEVVKDYGSIPLVRCNPQRLNQVFLNIILNAAQAIASHGVIRVSTMTEGEGIIVRIEDDGPGIALEHLGRLFEPFFTTKEVGKGTGLGLSISYDIVKSHGGEIRVDSELGKGAAFTVYLPVEPPTSEAPQEAGA
jgi:signal transduction histidine kinase